MVVSWWWQQTKAQGFLQRRILEVAQKACGRNKRNGGTIIQGFWKQNQLNFDNGSLPKQR